MVIAGVGGSGTRVIAQLVSRLGVYIGENLNFAHDNLDFPKVRRKSGWPYVGRMRATEFFETTQNGQERVGCMRWGWKYPASFLALRELSGYLNNIDYVHVIRDGFSMVNSKNHNQVKKYGDLFEIEYGVPSVELSTLRYWIRANDYALTTARGLANCRLHLIRYEDLCQSPLATVKSLASFLDLAASDDDLAQSAGVVVQRPARRRPEHTPDQFTAGDVADVARLGYHP